MCYIKKKKKSLKNYNNINLKTLNYCYIQDNILDEMQKYHRFKTLK